MNLKLAAQALGLFEEYANIVDSARQNEYLRLVLFGDGSGRVCCNDGLVPLFSFGDLAELVQILSEKLHPAR